MFDRLPCRLRLSITKIRQEFVCTAVVVIFARESSVAPNPMFVATPGEVQYTVERRYNMPC